jgi:hypothetical protein
MANISKPGQGLLNEQGEENNYLAFGQKNLLLKNRNAGRLRSQQDKKALMQNLSMLQSQHRENHEKLALLRQKI